MSRYEDFSGMYFLVLGLNTEIYGEFSVFSPNTRKYGPENPYLATFCFSFQYSASQPISSHRSFSKASESTKKLEVYLSKYSKRPVTWNNVTHEHMQKFPYEGQRLTYVQKILHKTQSTI